jgi:hypothetical protein
MSKRIVMCRWLGIGLLALLHTAPVRGAAPPAPALAAAVGSAATLIECCGGATVGICPTPAPCTHPAAPPAQSAAPPTPEAPVVDGGAPASAAPNAAAPAAPAASAPAPPSDPIMYVRDGQLRSHLFNIFVTAQLEPSMHPRLSFVGAHLLTKKSDLETRVFSDPVMASHQMRPVMMGDTEVQASGTVLMFALPPAKTLDFKSAVRLLPILSWGEPAPAPGKPSQEKSLIAEADVYLGNLGMAAAWTAATMLVLVVLLLSWSTAKSKVIRTFQPKPWLLLITGPDGYLSLWRAQLMIWTFAVGSLVFMYGLVQLKVPTIPETLVSLMGLSLATGVFGKMGQPPMSEAPPSPTPTPPAGNSPDPTGAKSAADTSAVSPNWFDLISTWNADLKQVELSIPKAQMVVWTLLVVLLFCIKSVLGGELWDVPWELVALTGFSQAGYLGDKVVVKSKKP